MDNDLPQTARYPEPGINYPSHGQGPAGANVPVREFEVQRELNQVSRDAVALKKLSEDLIQRLASVLSPRDSEINKEPQETIPGVSTPLATNIQQVHFDLDSVQKALKFIIRSLEL